MKRWWLRPLVRVLAAMVLPLAVPGLITALIWALPGDPASIICPPETCGGTEALAARWRLDAGPWHFFRSWVIDAVHGDLGNSWRVIQGVPVAELVRDAFPETLTLVALSLAFVFLGGIVAATGLLPRRLDGTLYVVGLVPAVLLALVGRAAADLTVGTDPESARVAAVRMVLGALALGLADGAFSGAVKGTRDLFEAERRQRYVGAAILRGERPLSNMLPNVTPALAGQTRARVLHLLSGAVIVEVIMGIDGMGDLLWLGTLQQDFGVVVAAATAYALLGGVLLLLQAVVEVATAAVVRRCPPVPAEEGSGS